MDEQDQEFNLAPRRRLFEKKDVASVSREIETPKSAKSRDLSSSIRINEPIPRAFNAMRGITFGKETAPVFYTEVLRDPETQFDQIIQKAGEYLAEVQFAIQAFKYSESSGMDLIEAEGQIDKTLESVTKISRELQNYLDEMSIRRYNDSSVNPRIVNTIKAQQDSLNKLNRSLKMIKKDMQIALKERERRDLLDEGSPFDNQKRNQRDAEEMVSDSTERLLNSKRILLETVQASSGTLGALASSSQSIQKNDEELNNQTDSISNTQSLLQKYGRRASTDKHLIWLGFLFFAFCALLVAYRRLL